MHLVVLWKENINLQLSIIDMKERAEDSFFEENWLKKFKIKIKEVNPINIKELLNCLEDLEITKKAFKNSLKDFKNETNDILKKYNTCSISHDEKSLTFSINKKQKNRIYNLRLEEVFCIDNESINDRNSAINKSEEWIKNKLVQYDLEIRDGSKKIIYSANEETEINNKNSEVVSFINELEKDFKILTDYNNESISFLEYMKKREIIPEILSRTEGSDSFIKEPTDKAVAALSAILIEKNMLKLRNIGQYKKINKLK